MLDWDQGLPLHKFLSVVCGSETILEKSTDIIYENKLELKVDLIENETSIDDNEPMWVKRFRT